MTSLVETLSKFPDLKSTASSLSSRHSWENMRDTLFQMFADSTYILSEFEKQLSSIRFDENNPHSFVFVARSTYSQKPPEFEMQMFMKTLFSKLPTYLLAAVIRAARRHRHVDWRTIEFDILLEILVDEINTNRAVQETKNLPPRGTNRNQKTDSVQLTHNEHSANKKHWLQDWVDTLKAQGAVVFKVVSTDNSKVAKARSAAFEVKDLKRRSDGQPYSFMAFRSGAEADSARKTAGLSGETEFVVYKEFRANPKNAAMATA